MGRLAWVSMGVVLWSGGCVDAPRATDSAGGGIDTALGTEGEPEGEADTASPDDALDVGSGNTAGADPDGDKGCNGIDFLFVVDNSGSMQNEQENLVASFPGFVQSIEEKVAELEADDFHVMVTDTDTIVMDAPGPYCSLTCPDDWTCIGDGGEVEVPCEFSEDIACYNICNADISAECSQGVCKEILGCDGCGCDLGAGKLRDKQGDPCNVMGGRRYMQAEQPDLGGTFACLAEVGIDGSGAERQAGAIIEALAEEALGPGGCNEGFVRDDAVLVVTMITDEDDALDSEGSGGEPPLWYQAVVDSKHGDPDAVVMLGLIGDGGQPGAICPFDESGTGMHPPRLSEFVTMFPRHVVGSVCTPNYADFLAQAVDLIKETCEDYTPPEG